MKLVEIYQEELANEATKYFIIDSGQHDKDIDFETYEWQRSKNNKIAQADLFIYRKPKKVTGRNEFLFSGVGKFGSISGNDRVVAQIEKPHPFINPIFQSDMESYQWKWKNRGNNWGNFWNEYGINSVNKEDFLYILNKADGEYTVESDTESVTEEKRIEEMNYFVDDTQTVAPARPWQTAWSRKVKGVYGYQCAVCGMKLTPFLVGSHIIPVNDKEYRNIRKDPANGICLCTIHDKAFDCGYLSVSDKMTIVISEKAKTDEVLMKYLIPYDGKTIRKPRTYAPKLEYLNYHRNKIFLKSDTLKLDIQEGIV